MKRIFSTMLMSGLLVLGVCSCNKTATVELPDINDGINPDEIVFRAAGAGFEAGVSTKATEVTSGNLATFNVLAATGTAGSSDAQAWNGAFTKNGSVYTGGKFWPSTNPGYHFYASNAALTAAASGATVAATNATDVVCAYLSSPTFKSTNTLTFEHIFARVGKVAVNAAAGYTVSNVSVKITPKTGGTYNLFTGNGKTDGTGWSSAATGAATEIANADGTAKTNDLYLVPGSYTLTASWTIRKGDYVETFTGKTSTVNLVRGKVNAITATVGGNASEISFNVSVTPWGTNDIPVTF